MSKNNKRADLFGALFIVLLIGVGVWLVFIGLQKEAVPNVAPMPENEFGISDPETTPCKNPTEPARGESLLQIPCVDVKTKYTQTTGKNGWLELPPPPYATWYKETQPLGSDKGNTLIAGHVDSSVGDKAPFYNLHKVQKGDMVFVFDDNGKRYDYKINTMQVYSREDVPENLFTKAGDPTLVLVTCSGPSIDSGDADYYMYNLVVTAELVTS